MKLGQDHKTKLNFRCGDLPVENHRPVGQQSSDLAKQRRRCEHPLTTGFSAESASPMDRIYVMPCQKPLCQRDPSLMPEPSVMSEPCKMLEPCATQDLLSFRMPWSTWQLQFCHFSTLLELLPGCCTCSLSLAMHWASTSRLDSEIIRSPSPRDPGEPWRWDDAS